MRLLVTFDAKALRELEAKMDDLARGAFRTQLAGVVNEIGQEIHQAIIPLIERQTGLHAGTIPRAVHDITGDMSYTLVTRGGNISLRYFRPAEGGGGVTAHPRDTATFYPGAFMTAGRPGGRHAIKGALNHQVYEQKSQEKIKGKNGKPKWRGSWGRKIKKTKSGVFIPEEMVRGAARATFERISSTRLNAEAQRILTLIA